MKVTKYEHACLVIEEQGKRLVIDPGEFAVSLTDLGHISAVVVTHAHPDHLNVAKVKDIINANPSVKVFTVSEAAKDLPKDNVMIAMPNSTCNFDDFRLEFTGGKHAVVHPSFPVAENIGICVNETFYYAGDSFALPATKPKVLAVPAGAPWMKSSEAMDYLAKLKPKQAFPTHNGFMNDAGQSLADNLLGGIAESNGIAYRFLKTGESISV